VRKLLTALLALSLAGAALVATAPAASAAPATILMKADTSWSSIGGWASGSAQMTFDGRVTTYRLRTTDHCDASGKGDGKSARISILVTYTQGTSTLFYNDLWDSNGCGNGFVEKPFVWKTSKPVHHVEVLVCEVDRSRGDASGPCNKLRGYNPQVT
jgi:hypothetical protein